MSGIHVSVNEQGPRVNVRVDVTMDIDDLVSTLDDVRGALDLIDSGCAELEAELSALIATWVEKKKGDDDGALVPVPIPDPAPNTGNAVEVNDILKRQRRSHPSSGPVTEPPRTYVTGPSTGSTSTLPLREPARLLNFDRTPVDHERLRAAAASAI